MPASTRAVFLDRDGTLNEDPGYLDSPDKLKLLPGVPEALVRLKNAGFQLIVVSNQSGVGRGLIREESLGKIHARMNEILSLAPIDQFLCCIHHPDAGCECRKPRMKLFEDARRMFGIDLRASYMVGDKLSDVQVGRAVGCKGTVLVRTGEGRSVERLLKPDQADFIADGLEDAATWILRQETAAR